MLLPRYSSFNPLCWQAMFETGIIEDTSDMPLNHVLCFVSLQIA